MPRLDEEKILSIDLALCDQKAEVLDAWRIQFERYPGVKIVEGSVLKSGCDACLCPGNSFGFMDSGLALHISETLGWQLQDEIREVVRTSHDGEILVGQAIVAATGVTPSWLVYAPTVRSLATNDEPLNPYLATRGALLAIRNHNRSRPEAAITSLAIPGLCTGAGGMHPLISARQIRHAYELITGLRGFGDKNLSQLSRREVKLRSLPASAKEEKTGDTGE